MTFRYKMHRTPPKYRRLQHLFEKDVPTQTEMRSYLGSSLAQIFNDYSSDVTREVLGVVPPLKGPVSENLWLSPSDQLIGKVVLKPPPTSKSTKACTHQGILEIGELAVLKHDEEVVKDLRKKFQDELMHVRKIFEAEKRCAIKSSAREIRKECENRIESLNEEFTKKLETALADAAEKSDEQLKNAVFQERRDVELEMTKKLRCEIGRVVDSLTNQFQLSVRAQRENMIAGFNDIMRKERQKVDDRIESYDRQRAQDMFAQRCELETQNMAKAAFILCNERMRCISETRAMRQCFERQIEALQELLLDSRRVVQNGETKSNRSDENSEERQFFEVVEIIDKDGNSWKPIQLEPEIPQLECTDQESAFAIVSSEMNFFPPDHYTDRGCAPSAGSLRTYDSPPFPEDKIYLRLDYGEGNDGQATMTGEAKTMGELAEYGRFIMGLKRSKPCSKNENSAGVHDEMRK